MTATQPDYLILDTIPAPIGAFLVAVDAGRRAARASTSGPTSRACARCCGASTAT